MDEAEEIVLKQKKRKVVIDPDQDDEDNTKVITTKTDAEKAERDNYDHKTNGNKAPEAKKQPEKKEEAKPAKTENKTGTPTKPKPAPEKDIKVAPVKKDTDQKPIAKPKPAPTGTSPAPNKTEANGQPQKKAVEEKKTSDKKPAPKVVKKKVESDSDSDSESESDSDSEDDKKKKKTKKTPPKKPSVKKDKGPEQKKVLKSKDALVYDVLKRWWYAMPEWPPADFDYDAELGKQKLRRVDQKRFRSELEIDANGNRKVYQIPSFVGVFKNSKGEIIDCRPKESCPSYAILKQKSILELCELLVKALRGQTEALEKSSDCDAKMLAELKRDLVRAEKSLEAQKNRVKT